MKIKYARPTWSWTVRGLEARGEVRRMETAVHWERHRAEGPPGLLVSEAARVLWTPGGSVSELLLVEGLTDFVYLTAAYPEAAVVGFPGTPGRRVFVTLRRMNRARGTIFLAQNDFAGGRHAGKVIALLREGGHRIVVQTVRRVKDVADVIRASGGRDPGGRLGLLEARSRLR